MRLAESHGVARQDFLRNYQGSGSICVGSTAPDRRQELNRAHPLQIPAHRIIRALGCLRLFQKDRSAAP
jgi:hypothetical protein